MPTKIARLLKRQVENQFSKQLTIMDKTNGDIIVYIKYFVIRGYADFALTYDNGNGLEKNIF